MMGITHLTNAQKICFKTINKKNIIKLGKTSNTYRALTNDSRSAAISKGNNSSFIFFKGGEVGFVT